MTESFRVTPADIFASFGGEIPEGFNALSETDQWRQAFHFVDGLGEVIVPSHLQVVAALHHERTLSRFFPTDELLNDPLALLIGFITDAKTASEER